MDSEANSSFSQDFLTCVSSVVSWYIFAAWFTVYFLFLPLFLYVLYIAFNKWKKPQPSASGGLSHSDVFTLNMVAMEMIGIFGLCFILYSYLHLDDRSMEVGSNTFVITMSGQTLFHSLTCVERYVAVVHPVTYLRLRGKGGVTVRNICIACAWVVSVLYSVPTSILIQPHFYGIIVFVASVASLPLVGYCSISVLCVLIRPKPGDGKKQINQSKRSTVYTMAAILGALLLRLIVFLVTGFINFWFWKKDAGCALLIASLWPALPSSLVLPLLFLHRTSNK